SRDLSAILAPCIGSARRRTSCACAFVIAGATRVDSPVVPPTDRIARRTCWATSIRNEASDRHRSVAAFGDPIELAVGVGVDRVGFTLPPEQAATARAATTRTAASLATRLEARSPPAACPGGPARPRAGP